MHCGVEGLAKEQIRTCSAGVANTCQGSSHIPLFAVAHVSFAPERKLANVVSHATPCSHNMKTVLQNTDRSNEW
eukprot:6174116-Pleurochrysis_carterae.AAC.1